MSLVPRAPYGSLLKGSAFKESKSKPAKALKVRKGRELNDAHLAAVRKCPCLSCDRDPAGVAAHVRMSGNGKPLVGMSTKPDDKWTLPLCDDCHTGSPDSQHRVGEVRFWSDLGIDPLVVCDRINAVSPDVEAMRAVIFAEREKRK